MLTEQQVNHFNTFGFLIFRQLFTPEEVETINAEFEHAFDRPPTATLRLMAPNRHWVRTMGT